MNEVNHNEDHLLTPTKYMMSELNKEGAIDFESLSLESLIIHIKKNHHNFLREQVSLIQHLAEMVLNDHKADYENLQQIYDLTCSLLDQIMPHLLKEERIIFPYIEYMEAAVDKGKKPKEPPFGSVEGPVLRMHGEHDQALNILSELRELSNNYTAPDDASDKWRQLYAKLSELDKDLRTHIHLEDDILFKKALELEAALR
jgi:regulator of cell morphogenesis and NO signaling